MSTNYYLLYCKKQKFIIQYTKYLQEVSAMNKNEKYFVSLISSHLNGCIPSFDNEIDYNELYRLASINNVTAIIYSELSKLSKDDKAKIENLNLFKQQFGHTIIDFGEKERAVKKLKSLFDSENIDYLFVKGEKLKNYYPVKELRESGDTDVIIRQGSIERVKELVKNEGFEITVDNPDFIGVNIYDKFFEIGTNNVYDHEYFKDIFSYCNNIGNEYLLDDYTHLLYVLCHIIKHFKYLGAGIKMFMDIDVLVRHIDNFDYDRIIENAKKLNIAEFTKSALSLCSYMFNTPVKAEIDFNKNTQLRQIFEDEIINAGAFGFAKRNIGSHYLINTTKNGDISRIRALAGLFFPSSDYLKNNFPYAFKHPVLLPIAWFHRLFIAVFKRGKHSISTINTIVGTRGNEEYIRLLTELDIEK